MSCAIGKIGTQDLPRLCQALPGLDRGSSVVDIENATIEAALNLVEIGYDIRLCR